MHRRKDNSGRSLPAHCKIQGISRVRPTFSTLFARWQKRCGLSLSVLRQLVFSDFDRSDRLRLVVGGRIITAASATRVDCYCARVEINIDCIEPARACAWSRVSGQPSVGRRHDRRYYWTADPSETTPLLCTARPVDQFRVCLSVAYVANGCWPKLIITI